jgi:hypothetical protein
MTPIVVCTIITKRYLAQARVLTQSLREHHPEARVYVLLADQVGDYFDPAAEPFELIGLADLPDRALIAQMCFYYNAFELCCALRPFLHCYLSEQTDHEAWLFLDADILVCASLDPLWQQLSATSILLSPHSLDPVAPNHVETLELNVLRQGIYNGGCVGLRRAAATDPRSTATVLAFIQWWQQRLTDYCFDDVALQDGRGLAVDQLWLNLVPLYFEDVAVLRHRGANVGHWNLIERGDLVSGDNGLMIGDEPLLFFHFSGWDWQDPLQVSRHNPLYQNAHSAAWAHLALDYRDRLQAHGHEAALAYPYAFDRFDNGDPIWVPMRRAYHRSIRELDRAKSGITGSTTRVEIDLDSNLTNAIANGTPIASPFARPEWFRAVGNPPGNSVILLQRALAEALAALAAGERAAQSGSKLVSEDLTRSTGVIKSSFLGSELGQDASLSGASMANVQAENVQDRGLDLTAPSPVSMDQLIQTIRIEALQRGDRRFEGPQGQGPQGCLLLANEIEIQINQAEAKAHSRQKWPDRLNRFPFNLSPKLQRAVLKLVDLLFRDQREVNLLLIQSLRQSLLLQRQLMQLVAQQDAVDECTDEDRR